VDPANRVRLVLRLAHALLNEAGGVITLLVSAPKVPKHTIMALSVSVVRAGQSGFDVDVDAAMNRDKGVTSKMTDVSTLRKAMIPPDDSSDSPRLHE
jgi:hypothetical protein